MFVLFLHGCSLSNATEENNHHIPPNPATIREISNVNADDEPDAQQTYPANEADLTYEMPPIPQGFGDQYQWVPMVPPTSVYIGMPDGTPVTIILQGRQLQFDGQGPVMLGGEVFVPVYGVFEYMELHGVTNFTIGWDEAVYNNSSAVINIVTIQNSDRIVTVVEGESSVTVGAVSPLVPSIPPIPVSQPAQKINGVFMLPLRPIAEAISVEVEWHEETDNVHVFSSGFGIVSFNEYGETVAFRTANPYL